MSEGDQFIVFPAGAASDALKRLVQLHPGLDQVTVVIRAMTAYHCLYEQYLEGAASEQVKLVMEHLDQQDEERGLLGG